MNREFGPRRGVWVDLSSEQSSPLTAVELEAFEKLDAVYRTLCAMLYNYAPMSGHPGGSISSGRLVAALLFDTMAYDFSRPDRDDADVISYAAGHKALGLYALWALRNEIVRIIAPALLPEVDAQLRLEDLLGFRRNPTNNTPLFQGFLSKALDGHPTPSTPFVPLATGASGVGLGSSLGVALALVDSFGPNAPRVHIIEGEGGLTPGRVSEALAFAGTASLFNVVVHLDWNQASIDSDRVTRELDRRGDYVQWDPLELFHLHDWNVIYVPDGSDFQKIVTAQRRASEMPNHQPTAIVYRTVKGWKYGIEGRASHGAGHKLCSSGFYDALPMPPSVRDAIPRCGPGKTLCADGANLSVLEHCYWDALRAIASWLEHQAEMTSIFTERLHRSRERLKASGRKPRSDAPAVEDVYVLASSSSPPPELDLPPGTRTTLRAQLGKTIGYLNRFSGGAFFIAAADLLSSTSVQEGGKDFHSGFFHAVENPDARLLSVGGICEDAISCVLSGLSSFGRHIGVGSSYGAFIAPLGHIASRLHAIGNQARYEHTGALPRPMVLICGHAGLKTGEDGPTHADPQPLQLLQENFPPGTVITLTPWEPKEIWHLFAAALRKRPSLIAPFVTRPTEVVIDREARGLAPARDAVQGLYRLRASMAKSAVTIVLQESAVTYEFVTNVLPRLESEGIDIDVYYVSSAELFDMLAPADRERIFPEELGQKAMGITGFTLPTMYRWIRSSMGLEFTMHPYMHGRYPGSGSGRAVLAEAGLDGESQYRRVLEYIEARARRGSMALSIEG